MSALIPNWLSPRKSEAAPAEEARAETDTGVAERPRGKLPTYSRKGKARGSQASARPSNVSEPQSPADDDDPAPEDDGAKEATASLVADLVAEATTSRSNQIPSASTPSASTPTAVPEVIPAASSPAGEQATESDDEEAYAFNKLLDHRWVGDEIEMEVEWSRGSSTWEPEAILQRDAAGTVLEYWRREGGRPAHPKDPDLYTIFAILDHSGDRKKLKVQWTGFGPEDATWEPRKTVDETAPGIAEDYWNTVRASDPPQRGRAGRGRGGGRGSGRRRGRGRG